MPEPTETTTNETAQLEAMRAELDRYRSKELAEQQRRRAEALARVERARRRMLLIPVVSSVITPLLMVLMIALQVCGCSRAAPLAPEIPPTTMLVTVGQLVRSDGGTCSVWKADEDLVVTAGHCCAEDLTYEIRRAAVVPGAELEVLVDDDKADVCVLRGYMIGPPLELAPRDPDIGSLVFSAGFPRGYYIRSMGLWTGRVSWTDPETKEVETGAVNSTYSQPGVSGAPLIGQDGRVVGVVQSCGLEPDKQHILENVNIATPIEKVRNALRKARRL